MDLSVVIPVWGRYQQFWPRAIAAISGQIASGAQPAEVVIARPSGESPGVATISTVLAELSGAKAPAVREVAIDPSGGHPGVIRNKALGRVETELVSFLDIDDRLLPGTWSELLSTHRESEIGSASMSNWKMWPAGQISRSGSPAAKLRGERVGPKGSKSQRTLFAAGLHSSLISNGAGSIHRTDLARQCGGYGGGIVQEDIVFGLAMTYVAPALFIPERPGRVWMVREGSLWHRHQPEQLIAQTLDEVKGRITGLGLWGLGQRALADKALAIVEKHEDDLKAVWEGGLTPALEPEPEDLIELGPDELAWIDSVERAERRAASLLG